MSPPTPQIQQQQSPHPLTQSKASQGGTLLINQQLEPLLGLEWQRHQFIFRWSLCPAQPLSPAFGVSCKVFSPGSLGGGGLREVWVLERERYWLQVKQLFVCTTRGTNKSGFVCWTFAYTICVLWKNHLIVLLLQGCENTGSASLCFKQHRNECEIRKSTSGFLQSVGYLNRQFWA